MPSSQTIAAPLKPLYFSKSSMLFRSIFCINGTILNVGAFASKIETQIRFLRGCSFLPLQTGILNSTNQTFRLTSFQPRQVKNEDSKESTSGESITLDQQTLEQNLELAIEEEDYVEAAKIRDSLRLLHEDGVASVLSANSRFYNAFREGNLSALRSLWAKGESACCVHPGMSGIGGHDHVMESWEILWAEYDFPLRIELKNVEVHVRGDVGYVTCVELVKTKGSSWGKQFATNVFERVGGRWFICVHHASIIDL